MKKLIEVPDPRLRKKSKPVKEINGKVKKLAGEMIEFLHRPPSDTIIAMGLAAIQLGEPIRMFAFKSNPNSAEQEDIQVVINPEVVYLKDFYLTTEGCLSIPGKRFALRRAKIAKIRGLNIDGARRSFRGHNTLAQVFQHELNHLAGVLIDTLGEEIQ